MSDNRYISAGVWLRAQDSLMNVVKALLVFALVGAPIVALITRSFMTGYLTAGFAVCAALWLIAMTYLMEPLRMDGIPIIERGGVQN